MSTDVGDRVQFDADAKSTVRTQGQEVLLRGHTGTVVGLQGSEAAVVAWDAGTYEMYGDIVSTPAGLQTVSSGSVELDSFEAPVHVDYIQGPVGAAGGAAEDTARGSPVDIAELRSDDIEELIEIVLHDPDGARRMAALEKFISGAEPVEVGVLSEVVCRSADRSVRARAIERLRERGNGPRALYLIRAFLDGRDITPPLNADERAWAVESVTELG